MAIPISNSGSKAQPGNDGKRSKVLTRRVSLVSARLFGVNRLNREAANQIQTRSRIANASFVDHCSDKYSVDLLEHMLQEEPDASVLRRWDLDADQWRQQIRYAIQMIRKN